MNNQKSKPFARQRGKNDFTDKVRRGIKTDSDEEFSFGKMLKNCIIAVGIACVAAIVLLAVFAMVSYSNPDPDKLTFPLSLAALYLGAFIAGIITARKNGEKILIGGILSGLIYLVVVFMISLIPEEAAFISKLSGGQRVIAHLALMAAVVIGSLIGMKKESKKPSMKHRMKIPRN